MVFKIDVLRNFEIFIEKHLTHQVLYLYVLPGHVLNLRDQP